MKNGYSLMALANLAALAAMGGAGWTEPKPKPRRYSEFCGPPAPTSRQFRRQMERNVRKASKADQ